MSGKIVLYYNDLVFRPSASFLFKDFGQVPYVLAQMHGAELEFWIATRDVNPGFTEFRGKRVVQFGKAVSRLSSRLDFVNNPLLMRAINRARGVTHLIVFPFSPATDLAVVRRAKRRWPGVKIIMKLDANREFLERIGRDWVRRQGRRLRLPRQCDHYRALLEQSDVVICETTECERILREGFLGLDLDARLARVFSGLSEAWLSELGVRQVGARERKRSIIVSGRISSRQKNTVAILDAGPPPDGWTVDFIGDVDPALAKSIALHRALNPAFDRQYRFHGRIDDKRSYFALMMNARALLMNSRGGEGFPNVYAEAHYCGLTIATSDVSGAFDATGGGRWGLIYPRDDVAAIRDALQALTERVGQHDGDPEFDAYRRDFIWEHSLNQPAIRRVFEAPLG